MIARKRGIQLGKKRTKRVNEKTEIKEVKQLRKEM